jgi:hypothetical protein
MDNAFRTFCLSVCPHIPQINAAHKKTGSFFFPPMGGKKKDLIFSAAHGRENKKISFFSLAHGRKKKTHCFFSPAHGREKKTHCFFQPPI